MHCRTCSTANSSVAPWIRMTGYPHRCDPRPVPYQGKGCDALPAEWHDAQSRENKALSWFNAMATTLYFHKNNRIFPLRLLRKFCHVPVDAVGKTVYLITADFFCPPHRVRSRTGEDMHRAVVNTSTTV